MKFIVPYGIMALLIAIVPLTIGLSQIGTSSGPPASSQPASQPALSDALDPVAKLLSVGIVGSKHDFTDNGKIERDLCLPCHTMHLTATQAPLLVRRPATSEPLRPYQTRGIELDSASLLCLSCHDGTAAPDVFAGSHATTWSDSAGREFGARPRLTGHPVGVRYPVGLRGYESPEYVTGIAGLKLPAGRIQCTSCHDPHNANRHSGLLIVGNERSRLCLSCHRL